jgi:hypothetical protein
VPVWLANAVIEWIIVAALSLVFYLRH